MNTSNTNTNSNQMAVPEAKAAMKRFKTEVATELGVPLKQGYIPYARYYAKNLQFICLINSKIFI